MRTYRRFMVLMATALLLLAGTLGAKETDKEDDCKRDAKSVIVSNVDVRPNDLADPRLNLPTATSPASPNAGEQINWQVISSGGTDGTSTNYGLKGTVGQTASGLGSSTNYGLIAGYWQNFGPAGCCVLRVGDANGLGGDEPTIGDVSVMIDAKFITGTCEGILGCFTEADVNQSGGLDAICDDITIGDISTLIDYLFITGKPLGLAECL